MPIYADNCGTYSVNGWMTVRRVPDAGYVQLLEMCDCASVLQMLRFHRCLSEMLNFVVFAALSRLCRICRLSILSTTYVLHGASVDQPFRSRCNNLVADAFDPHLFGRCRFSPLSSVPHMLFVLIAKCVAVVPTACYFSAVKSI